MNSRKHKTYHLFLVLCTLNMTLFYLFTGHSTISGNELAFYEDQRLVYSMFISLLIFITWLCYFFLRRKLRTVRLIWLHLCIHATAVFVSPWVLYHFYDNTPRRYLSNDNDLNLLDRYSFPAFVIALILIMSIVLLLMNIKKPQKRITLLDAELPG